MSNTLWLINPHQRGTTGAKASMKKERTAAQKAATKKMLAARKKSLAAKAKTYAANPVKPLQKSLKLGDSKQPRTYVMKDKRGKKTTVTYKRNPIDTKRAKGMLTENIKPAAVGAIGALGIDIIWGKLPVPASLRSGMIKYPVKAALAIGLGMMAEKVLPKDMQKHAVDVVRGSLTVILHEAGKGMIQQKYPTLALAAYEEDELAEILADEQMNGYYYVDEPNNMGETLRLEGLPQNTSHFNVPQYDDISY